MFDIDITHLQENAHEYSANEAELGDRAAQITWENSRGEAERWRNEGTPPLVFRAEEVREHFREYDAWEEIDQWDVDTLLAMTVQEAASGIRELESVVAWDEDTDWYDLEEFERQMNKGHMSGRVYPTEDHKLYLTIGM